MASEFPQQGVFLYKAKWTAEIDKLMLRTIIQMKKAMKWEGTVIPPEIICEASDVIAAEVVLKENSFASAYYYVADPEFRNLSILFGPNSIKSEKEKVIVISDSTVPVINLDNWVGPTKVFDYPTTEGSDSVSSPVIGTISKHHRKLFNEDNPHNNRDSTNQEELRLMRAPKPPKTPVCVGHPARISGQKISSSRCMIPPINQILSSTMLV
ncbi:hypothetical protein AAHA92_06495 [Salvia divinorum]|uniref:Uncharacterized protein n=1 Tax=Salvia divinorum TaxID=28513 RepID=A0ABD1I6U5_SALDI